MTFDPNQYRPGQPGVPTAPPLPAPTPPQQSWPPGAYGPNPGYPPAAPATTWGVRPAPQEHPQGGLIIGLGLVSLVLCQLLGPVAWYMGSKARKEVKASPVGYSNANLITTGWALGIVATLLLMGGIIAYIAFWALQLAIQTRVG